MIFFPKAHFVAIAIEVLAALTYFGAIDFSYFYDCIESDIQEVLTVNQQISDGRPFFITSEEGNCSFLSRVSVFLVRR